MARIVVITAGGRGRRMGGALPKQFAEIGGRPVLMHTIAKFWGWNRDAEILVTLPPDMVGFWRTLCENFAFKLPHRIIEGGESRYRSVANALAVAGDGLIGVHDGVRPFVSEAVIEACFAAAQIHGGAVPVVDMLESIRELGADGASWAVDRRRFVVVQTPQVFRSDLLKAAYRQPERADFTDEASVVEAHGGKVSTAPGNVENIKLTQPMDMWLADQMLKQRRL
ncbi:MAG: 2-C-methyl-D-erythritol 4-phosphate cytidylyltransferase [Tannerellaceae bacterium]|nr:2-C-methyl-D-erythritol 4-phosphate cytidylyltransferase [Tannerellaceae bacterium]